MCYNRHYKQTHSRKYMFKKHLSILPKKWSKLQNYELKMAYFDSADDCASKKPIHSKNGQVYPIHNGH
jgi:hypothetical protein